MGASLLVFANKTDVGGCMTDDEIEKVEDQYPTRTIRRLTPPGTAAPYYQDTQMDRAPMQRNEGGKSASRIGMGGPGRKGQAVSVLRVEFEPLGVVGGMVPSATVLPLARYAGNSPD